MNIGAFLREQRETKGLTQREFSERAGVSRATLGHYEAGRRTPSFAAVEALLGGIGLQLCGTAEPLWADVDRETAALREAGLDERIDRVPVWPDWWHERLAGGLLSIRPLSDVESDDPWVTRVLARMRAGLPSAA